MAKVLILSGAGISAESGISTFRDSGGLWEEYDVSVVCNYDSMQKHEELTIEFYDKRRAELESKEPNYAHKVIADLKRRYGRDIVVITQNVDNLFEKAGLKSSDIIHLHGFLREIRCQDPYCEQIFDIGYTKQREFNGGGCPSCGSKLRPNIVFFGEQAPKYEELGRHVQDCELLVVIGTSGNVIGVNTMAQFATRSILNNYEPSSAINDAYFSKVLYKKATEAVDEIAEEIESFLDSINSLKKL
ncbi:MAG: Sir2 family NAD-dependent protein deacetylase [Sulfurimonas sp.]|uniref:SIR2 family NAD-dependent protein deacylase n=1 Tax=Sulfurimonas sp. TaxID=2022749 RepID=UPI0025E2D26C|nr:Sir2 family NAD-dependent protein deacetylase [Sulfurimonas sp.]MCK9454252.1 NAD-dependent deacetylase [Sulfurimonas sp.]